MSRSWEGNKRNSGGVGGYIVLIVIVLAALIAAIVLITSCKRLDPGEAGVVINYATGTASGNTQVESVDTGRYFFIFPGELKRFIAYPISQQTYTMVRRAAEGKVVGDDSVACKDRNGIPINVDSSTLWRVDPKHVADIYLLRPNIPLDSNDDNDLATLIVRREIRTAITNACSFFTYDDVYGVRRLEFGQRVAELLQPELTKSFIQLDTFQLGEIYLHDEQVAAISRVANAQQAAKEAAFLKEKAENEAKAKVAEAEGQKTVRSLQAEAEANYIKTIQDQLSASPKYIEYVYANRWNGIVPTTVVLGNGQSIPLLGSLQLNTLQTPTPAPTAPAGQ